MQLNHLETEASAHRQSVSRSSASRNSAESPHEDLALSPYRELRCEGRRMRKIEATLRHSTYAAVRDTLPEFCPTEITVSEVHCLQQENPPKFVYRGAAYHLPATKTKVEMLVPAARLAELVQLISGLAGPAEGSLSDRIVVYEIAESLCLRRARPAAAGR